jgi:dihydropteroate synthase
MILMCASHTLDLTQPQVMGILNITPDSFSDGGHYVDPEQAMLHALQMQQDGAAIIDIGGESTRPGAQAVSANEEIKRVVPLIKALRGVLKIPISIDTSKPEVMLAAVEAGAGLINDIYALRKPGSLQVARECGVPVCLMHMQGEPATMQRNPVYKDVVAEINAFFLERVGACIDAGISAQRLLLDPGFGFGKTLMHNLTLLARLEELVLEGGMPLVVGLSRKSMISQLLGERRVEDRLYGGLAAAVLAATRGASLIRTHDVQATVDALRVYQAVRALELTGQNQQ